MGLELICTLLVLRVGQRLVGNLKKASHQGTMKVIYPFTVVTTVDFLMPPEKQKTTFFSNISLHCRGDLEY